MMKFAFLSFGFIACAAPPHAERGTWHSDGKADDGATCAGACGGEASVGCWCDDQCAMYGDCCPDVKMACAPAPTNQVDLFDGSLAMGTPADSARMVALFQPGTSTAPVGGALYAERTRACNTSTGCGPWTPLANASFFLYDTAIFEYFNASMTPTASSGTITTLAGGDFNIAWQWNIPTSSISPPRQIDASHALHSSFSATPAGPWGDDTFDFGVHFEWQANGRTWSSAGQFATSEGVHSKQTIVTDEYVYVFVGRESSRDSSGSYTQGQYVMYGRFAPSETPVQSISGETIVATW
jgi:hypothetical protein